MIAECSRDHHHIYIYIYEGSISCFNGYSLVALLMCKALCCIVCIPEYMTLLLDQVIYLKCCRVYNIMWDIKSQIGKKKKNKTKQRVYLKM